MRTPGYDYALAETIIGLFKTEVINQLESEIMQWIDWFNSERLLEPRGYIAPIEAEEKYEQP